MNSYSIDSSVWINASAGTGKTKILIDRVLTLLLEGRKNILCLTFTNAAANEMEDRIFDTLSRWAICPGLDLNVHGFTQKKVDKAKRLFSELANLNLVIQTIHAFCYKLVSSFPAEAGIAPNCTLSECKELHPIVFDYTLNHASLRHSINVVAEKADEDELRNLLYTLCTKRPIDNLQYVKDKLGVPDKISDLPLQSIKRLSDILSEGSKRDQNYSKTLQEWLNTGNIEHLVKVFIKSDSCEKKNVSSIMTKEIEKKFPDAAVMVESVQHAVVSYIKDIDAQQIFSRTSNLLNIFQAYISFYKDEKLRNALIDYNDVIDLAIKLISNHDWILFNLDQKIDHILIDEAQDNSIGQWKIITSLCNEFFVNSDEKRTLFVVGDVKQSIYRFQGANPLLFTYMQKYFYEKTEGRNWLSDQLEISFRSAPEILMLVDKLFNHFRKEISFSNYEIKHIPSQKNEQGYVEIWPLLPKLSVQQGFNVHYGNEEEYVTDRLLARTIAHSICEWLNNGRILVVRNRYIEPKDIMILVRQRNMLVDYIISELKRANVPVLGRDHFRIMDHIVAQDLIALAEFLLLPSNDLALASILKSPLVNCTEEDLFNIAYNRKELSLWTSVQHYSQSIYDELNNLIELSKIEPPLVLFIYVLNKSREKFVSRLGTECLEIIDEFMGLLSRFWFLSLQKFVQWIKENNPEVKNHISQNCNAVRVITIHKSKGLQAPIVFLVDTNTVPRNSENIIFDESGAPFWCGKNNNIYCDQIRREKKTEDYNEYLRLLYVALTRAESELYILGKEPVQKNSWYDLITTYGCPYEKKRRTLFEDELEILCINPNYPYLYRKHSIQSPISMDCLDVTDTITENQYVKESTYSKELAYSEESILTKKTIHIKAIYTILQYMFKIGKARRKDWLKKYLESINAENGIYSQILEFNKQYEYLFDLEGKSGVTLTGRFNDNPIFIYLDRVCVKQDKVMAIIYNESSTDKIKKQLLVYQALIKKAYTNKQIECVIICVESLNVSFFHIV
jgi:ATP-dependent helicase/nuclease subunit A